MKLDEFQQLVDRFVRGPVMPLGGQRHVYIWRREASDLEPRVTRATVLHLDLHRVAGALPTKPTEPEGARRVLERAMEQALRADGEARSSQQVVVVTGCDLLMRYGVSMRALYQAAGDSRMVILVAPAYPAPAHPLPRYVDFRASATLDYLKSRLPDAPVIE